VNASVKRSWSCPFDTHNDVRFAVKALSGELLLTIYADQQKSVRAPEKEFLAKRTGLKFRSWMDAIIEGVAHALMDSPRRPWVSGGGSCGFAVWLSSSRCCPLQRKIRKSRGTASHSTDHNSMVSVQPRISFERWGEIPSDQPGALPRLLGSEGYVLEFLQRGFYLANDGGTAYDITVENFEIEPSVVFTSRTIARIPERERGFALVWLEGSPPWITASEKWDLLGATAHAFEKAMAEAFDKKYGTSMYRTSVSMTVRVRYRDSGGCWYRSCAELIYVRPQNRIEFGPTTRNVIGDGRTSQESSPVEEVARNAFRLHGSAWELSFDGKTVLLPDRTGLRYIAELLRKPRTAIEAAKLAGVDTESTKLTESSGIELTDEQAIKEVRAELVAKKAELAGLQQNDWTRRGPLEEEISKLEKYLQQVTDHQGHPRKVAGTAERARTRVTTAIGRAIAHISKEHAALGCHLKESIKTGITVIYAPTEVRDWQF
jgi:hypothetical protein